MYGYTYTTTDGKTIIVIFGESTASATIEITVQ
jgi:hypothetical protein